MEILKVIWKKIRVGRRVLRETGVRGLGVTALEFLAKSLRRTQQSESAKIKHLIYVKARYEDVIRADYISKPFRSWMGTTDQKLTLNWLMPPPGKGSGGHLNIFRFIEYLEKAGHACRIYIYTGQKPGDVADIFNLMGDSYPKLEAKMEWIEDGNDMQDAHGIFATSWETAYASFNSTSTGRRFYFVQDFEPYFYPIGTLSVLAENTYRFGFYGVTAGRWLATKLNRDYDMATDSFDFGSDKTLYSLTNESERKEIFFYARPYTERRAFEMGVMVLDLFHQKHPDYVINIAGWDVSDYNIPFPYKNLKTLEVSQLGDLYNKCAAGLVLSLTNMSLLPLELLSCGTIPVVNDGENNRLVSDNPYIKYCPNNPASLANALSEVVSRNNKIEYAQKASASVENASWDDSGKKFVTIVERETRIHA